MVRGVGVAEWDDAGKLGEEFVREGCVGCWVGLVVGCYGASQESYRRGRG